MSRRQKKHCSANQNNVRSIQPGVVLDLPSGYKLRVRPLPPYYLDAISDAIVLPEYPKRIIALEAGDTVAVDYKLPEVEPGPDDPDYSLYMRWISIHQIRYEREQARRTARVDYLLANCVEVLDGPAAIDDPEWAANLEAAFDDYHVPTHPGKRKLAFLKHVVITSQSWVEAIVHAAMSEEVTMQGVLSALLQFQHNTGS